jgi:hypothetical protein
MVFGISGSLVQLLFYLIEISVQQELPLLFLVKKTLNLLRNIFAQIEMDTIEMVCN